MIVFPAVTTVLAVVCAVALLRDYITRPRPDKIAWSIAFAIFAIAAGTEVTGGLFGWSPLLARVYYVLGATLVVGFLAVGELYLLMPRAWSDRAAGAMMLLSALAVALVSHATVDPGIADDGWEALERGPALTALTISINSLGTLILIGGLVYSAVRLRQRGIMRNRTIGCLLIALGTLAVASGGTLTRLGNRQFLYIAMSVGIGLIFAGYLRARRPDPQPAVRAATTGSAPAHVSS